MGESLVAIVFRIVNLGVLVAFAVYLFKKNILGMVHEKIQQKIYARAALEQKKAELSAQQENMRYVQEQQKKLEEDLLAKVRTWHEVTALANAQEGQKSALYEKRLQQYVDRKAQAIIDRRVIMQVMPQALDKAQQELTTFFAQEPQGQESLQHIIQAMQKDNA